MSVRRLSAWRAARHVVSYRPGLFALCFVQLVAWNGSTLLLGWLLQRLFDALSGGAPAGTGAYGIIAMIAAAEAATLAVMGAGVVRAHCWQRMRGLLRLNLLRAQVHSGEREAGRPAASSGEALSRIRDDVDDFLRFPEAALHMAGKVVLAVGAMVILLSIQPFVLVAVGLPLVAVVAVTRLVSARIGAYRVAYRQVSARVTAQLGEAFGGLLAVKSAHAADGILRHLGALNHRRRRAGLRDQLLTVVLGRFTRGTMDLSIGVVLLLAVPATQRGDFTAGDLALFVTYIGSLVWLPHYTGRMLAQHRQAGVAIDRMTSLLPPGRPDALVTHRPLRGGAMPSLAAGDRSPLDRLTVCGLTAVHPSSGRGTRDVSLTLERGTLTVVTGPAGAGKTSLLRAVLGLMPAQAGTVWWNDTPVDDAGEFLVPPRSAYVPQVPHLFSESLLDNLLLGHEEDAHTLRAAVHTAVLGPDVASMPAGLRTHVGTRGVRLSGGQVQRAAIARALVRRPELLVLDDVSSALDVETERRLWDRLLADTGRTLLVVSNRPATVARADQVIRLDRGRVRTGPVRHAG